MTGKGVCLVNITEFFERPSVLAKRIGSREEMIRLLRAKAGKITRSMSPLRVQQTGGRREMADCLDLAADLYSDMERDRQELDAALKDIMDVIREVGRERHRSVLVLRYIVGEQMTCIARDMGCSRSAVYRLLDEALEAAEGTERFGEIVWSFLDSAARSGKAEGHGSKAGVYVEKAVDSVGHPEI